MSLAEGEQSERLELPGCGNGVIRLLCQGLANFFCKETDS